LPRWASHLGARVIGTVGSAGKIERARHAGAAKVILYREENLAERVDALTDGQGAAVVYDAIGADTFQASLACLGFGGHLVTYGQASGPVPPFAPAQLAHRSLTVSRPIVFHYLRTPAALHALADDTFSALARRAIMPINPVTMPLERAADAHRLLESGASPGAVVLLPQWTEASVSRQVDQER
jgi:NADPH2:quinone reductase